MHMRANQETNDPASWARASYSEHPVDVLEPEPDFPNAYREAGIRHLRVSICWAEFVLSARNVRLATIQVSIALDLPPTQGKTLTQIANELGVTKQAISRGVTRFLRIARLEPPPGLKSINARIEYRTCRFQI
jgi:hypothetical protein